MANVDAERTIRHSLFALVGRVVEGLGGYGDSALFCIAQSEGGIVDEINALSP
jgi:hypothetical protein